MLQLKFKNIVKNYFQRSINKNFSYLWFWHSSCINKVLVEKFRYLELFLDNRHLIKIKIEN